MNLIDYYVTEILSEPVKVERDWGSYWKVKVKYQDYGEEATGWLTAPTEEDARKIVVEAVHQH